MAALDDCYNIFDMREAAKRRLPRGIFEFRDRATETTRRHRTAPPSDIAATERGSMSRPLHQTMLFGKEVNLPMIIAPTGPACAGYSRRTSRRRPRQDPFAMSTASMTAMEEVATKSCGRLWFQLNV